jgi:hypothetical protein
MATTSEATARKAVFEYASTKAEAWEIELARFGSLWREYPSLNAGAAGRGSAASAK